MLGYAVNPGLALQALIVIVVGLAATGARSRLNLLFPVKITPRITNPYAQGLTMGVTLVMVNLSSRLIITGQLASISSFGPINDLAILFQVSIMETLLVQYFLFYLFFAAFAYLAKNYWVAGLAAAPSSGVWAYVFHFYVYGQTAPVWNWVMLAFTILSMGYWLTGNILVPMIPHVLIDTLPIALMLLLPGSCPGLGGLC
jgi:hypothetical protein